MKAVRSREGEIVTVETDRPHGDGVRVRMASAGVCGSDLHMHDLGLLPPDVTIGHEVAGFLADGRAVAVEPITGCGVCPQCLEGRHNICKSAGAGVLGFGRNGGMAEEVLVDASQIVPLASGLDVTTASLVEPLGVAVHALRMVDARPPQRILVIGAGPIGLCALAVARHVGLECAIVTRHDAQQRAAEMLGASPATDEPYDLVIEAAGSKSALADAVARCRRGGTVVLLGMYWGTIEAPGIAVCLREISIVPAAMYGVGPTGRDIDAAAAVLATHPVIADALITHRFPLDASAEAFAAAADRVGGAIKVVFSAEAT
ncbi:MAG: alcohol dehydrogenase catalytic domain-containing protein [Acidimicrobiales bacterium]